MPSPQGLDEVNSVPSTPSAEPRRTHRQRAYGVIRRNILLGRLEEGAKINECELAAQFGMSRIPVREALLCLHGEGLISKSGNRGLKVAEMSPEEVRSQVEFRSIVECAAVRLACTRIKPDLIERLQELVEEQEVLVHAKDWQAFRESDVVFHHLLLKASENSFMAQLSGSPALGAIFSPKNSIDMSTVEGHRKILAAVRNGAADEAEKLIYEHIAMQPYESRHQPL